MGRKDTQTRVDEIGAYIDWMRTRAGLSVSVHFTVPCALSCCAGGAQALMAYNTHQNPYCMQIKTLPGRHRACRLCQVMAIRRCAHAHAFTGACHAGVWEYVHGFFAGDRPAGIICVSGYRAPAGMPARFAADGTLAALYADSLSGAPGPEAGTLASPLARMLEQLLACMEALPGPPPSPREEEYARVLQFVNEHRSDVSLPALCRAFGRSASYISRLFNEYSGQTLRAYCNARKIEDARALLAGTSMSVTEVAYTAGFGDVSHFIALFRENAGCTPLAWRREVRAVGR